MFYYEPEDVYNYICIYFVLVEVYCEVQCLEGTKTFNKITNEIQVNKISNDITLFDNQ